MTAMRRRFAEVASELLDSDETVAVVLADIGVRDFADAALEHCDRVVNVGIREQLMVSVASGLALGGYRPIIHSYTPFLVERAYEQIKLDLAHQDVGAVLVSVGGSFDASSEGRTHQAPEDVAILSALPGVSVHVPGHADELETLLRHAVAADGTTYVRLAAQSNRTPVTVRPGLLSVVRSGTRHAMTIVAVGPMLDPVMDAVADIDATVLYATTVRPFDHRTLRAHAASGEVVVVEPYLAGTSAGEIAHALADRPHRQLGIGVPNAEHRHYGRPEEHAAAHRLDAAGIRASILDFLSDSGDRCLSLHVA